MRIFTAVRHSTDPKFYYGGLWSGNFYPALQRLGHQIIESQVDLLPASHFMNIANQFTPQELVARTKITQDIIDEVKIAHQKQPIGLFLSYFYNSHFDPAGFAEIHHLGIPTVNFYCNSIYQFELVDAIAAKAQFSWHPEKAARSRYLEIGANPVWVQMGADPTLYHPVSLKVRRAKACFIGQRYADRDRLLAALMTHQIPVDIYGGGWSKADYPPSETGEVLPSVYLGRKQLGRWGRYAQVIRDNFQTDWGIKGVYKTLAQFCYRQQSRQLDPILAPAACGFADCLSDTFAQYEVVLNFSHVWANGRPGSALIPHVRLRDFEAPLSRTCYLTGYSEEIEEFYELGQEIDTYRTAEELVERTRFYLDHPQAAEKLREAGYKRAIRDHTWERRFEQLFATIELTP
jgi:spore maturation protein CgeB